MVVHPTCPFQNDVVFSQAYTQWGRSFRLKGCDQPPEKLKKITICINYCDWPTAYQQLAERFEGGAVFEFYLFCKLCYIILHYFLKSNRKCPPTPNLALPKKGKKEEEGFNNNNYVQKKTI